MIAKPPPFFSDVEKREANPANNHLNPPEQVHNLLRCMLLHSRHTKLPLFQFVSSQLAQKNPGKPG